MRSFEKSWSGADFLWSGVEFVEVFVYFFYGVKLNLVE
jgi:hypothetical protein